MASICFRRVGKLAEIKRLQQSNNELKLNGAISVDTVGSATSNGRNGLSYSKVQLYQDEYKRNTGYVRRIQQFYAMVVKKCIYAIRNRILLLIQVNSTQQI